MGDANDEIKILLSRLELLNKRQEDFSREIQDIRNTLLKLQNKSSNSAAEVPIDTPKPETEVEPVDQVLWDFNESRNKKPGKQQNPLPSKKIPQIKKQQAALFDTEKFIGENLINKIGIIIIIIGVGIGVQYAIDRDLLSPLVRIILGYVMGFSLLGIALFMRRKYESFSVVLLSGALATLYFVTFSAYSFYGLMPQGLAFFLMVLFTSATVYAAYYFNKQFIALIGMVGAYAVPFLLSEGSGRADILFSYIAIIDIGILIIALRKTWKTLYFSAFLLTWIIFGAWIFTDYDSSLHRNWAILFSLLYLAIFYFIHLSYKLNKDKDQQRESGVLIWSNAFIFFGYSLIIHEPYNTAAGLGFFTFCNALLHFAVALTVYKWFKASKELFHLIVVLGITFTILAVPIWFDGTSVTRLWILEALALFWLGRYLKESVYERYAYILMLLSLGSLLEDWHGVYYNANPSPADQHPFLLNLHFLNSFVVAISIGLMALISKLSSGAPAIKMSAFGNWVRDKLAVFFPVVLYLAFFHEISNYWSQHYHYDLLSINGFSLSNEDFLMFQRIWLVNYSVIFLSGLTAVNLFFIKKKSFARANRILQVIVTTTFLIIGLYELSELREAYLDPTTQANHFHHGAYQWLRYLSLSFMALLIVLGYRSVRRWFQEKGWPKYTDLYLHTVIIWVASSELFHWMDIINYEQSYKLILSILWGCYSLLLVIIGMSKDKKYLRIAAMMLFAFTLLKLFLYDIAHLNTISKTIVFVSLGILLLIISYQYHRNKAAQVPTSNEDESA